MAEGEGLRVGVLTPGGVVVPAREVAVFGAGPDWAAMLRVTPRAMFGYLVRAGWTTPGQPLDLGRLPTRFASGADAHLLVHLAAWVEGRDVGDVWREVIGSAGHA